MTEIIQCPICEWWLLKVPIDTEHEEGNPVWLYVYECKNCDTRFVDIFSPMLLDADGKFLSMIDYHKIQEDAGQLRLFEVEDY